MLKYNEPGHVCPRTKRMCVTVRDYDAMIWELGERWAYQYSPTAELMGLDPWRLVEGADRVNDQNCDIWYADGYVTRVPSDFAVYV